MNLPKKIKFYLLIQNLIKTMKYYLTMLNFFKIMPLLLSLLSFCLCITIKIKCRLFDFFYFIIILFKTLYFKIVHVFRIIYSPKIRFLFKTLKNFFKTFITKTNIIFPKQNIIKFNFYLLFFTPDILRYLLKNIILVLLIAFIAFLAFLLCFFFWFHYGFAFIKGDPIACPHFHFKKTYYYEDAKYCYFDYYPYLNEMKKNLKDDPTKAYYKWVYYFDPNDKTFWKVEYYCVYKTGMKKKIWVFDINDIMYRDSKNRLHYVGHLILCRVEENWLIGQYFEILEPEKFKNENIIKRVYSQEGLIIGFDINIGEVRYEVLIEDHAENLNWEIYD